MGIFSGIFSAIMDREAGARTPIYNTEKEVIIKAFEYSEQKYQYLTLNINKGNILEIRIKPLIYPYIPSEEIIKVVFSSGFDSIIWKIK